MKPSMADVARAAGVSKSTVSRALAGDRRVKPETRLRIEEAARRLGYSPHRVASALARGRTYMVAVAPPSPPRSFSDPFFLEFLGAVGDRLTAAGYNVVLTVPDGVHASVSGSLRELVVGRMVDGVLLTEKRVNDTRISLLKEQGVPFVVVGRVEAAGVYCVDGDNMGGAELAVRHLLDLGHRHIACVAGPQDLEAARQRLKGFMAAMRAAGAEVLSHRVVEADFTLPGGRAATRRLLEAERAAFGAVSLTAIFACNDLMAMGAIAALRDAGLQVPQDVSVVGFDGIGLARLVEPPLTTVAQPVRELGTLAVELLLEQMGPARASHDGPASAPGATSPAGPRSVVLACSLQSGRSTALCRTEGVSHGG